MLNIDRQRIILDQLYQKGSVKVSELSKELGVHEETIRRDLKALAAKWDIKTVYGGAVLKNTISSPAVQEINMLSKRLWRETDYCAQGCCSDSARTDDRT